MRPDRVGPGGAAIAVASSARTGTTVSNPMTRAYSYTAVPVSVNAPTGLAPIAGGWSYALAVNGGQVSASGDHSMGEPGTTPSGVPQTTSTVGPWLGNVTQVAQGGVDDPTAIAGGASLAPWVYNLDGEATGRWATRRRPDPPRCRTGRPSRAPPAAGASRSPFSAAGVTDGAVIGPRGRRCRRVDH